MLFRMFTDNSTKIDFKNENLEKRNNFLKIMKAGDIKIVSVVGSVKEPENGNVCMKLNNHSVDIQGGATTLVSDVHPFGFAFNTRNTVSEEAASIVSMEKITGNESEGSTGNEKYIGVNTYCNEFKEPTTMVAISAVALSTGSTISAKNIEQSGGTGIDGKRESFFCKLCCLSFSFFEELEDHLRSSHVVQTYFKRFKCGPCKKEFCAIEIILKHLLSRHTEEKIYSCGGCGADFPYPHSTTARRDTKFYCGRCQTELNDAKSKQEKSENRPRSANIRSCEICLEVFSSKMELQSHLLLSHAVKQYVCYLCYERFAFQNSLKRHFLTHDIQPRFDVSESQSSINKVSNHDPVECSPPKKLFTCEVCKKQYDQWISLKRHSRTHILKHSCDSCEKAFSVKRKLRIHQRQHTHPCDACELTFSSRKALKDHALTHPGMKPHTCETCGRGFASSERLMLHLRVHTGEKPYVCDICQRGFCRKAGMYAHRRTHTGERPFECDVCQKGFVYKSQLKTHQLSHVKTELED